MYLRLSDSPGLYGLKYLECQSSRTNFWGKLKESRMYGGIDFFNGFGDGFLRPSTLHNINNETLTRRIQENTVDYALYYSVNNIPKASWQT